VTPRVHHAGYLPARARDFATIGRRVSLTPRRLTALCAVFIAAAGISGCGDSVPGNAIAKVDEDPITRATFDHWMRIAAASSQAQSPDQRRRAILVPKPPDFVACVAQKRETAPKPAKGQPKPTEAQFKQQCKQEYEGLRDQVLQFLISSQWILGEAADQDISISDAQVRRQFETTKKQSFPKEADFKKFLEQSGMTLQDVLFRVKVDALSNRLREKVTKGKDRVTNDQIQEYYDKNKSRFAQPERRDLRIVLTKSQSRAQAAKRAIESGQSFKTVARRYSIDQASKSRGGVLLAVAKGQQEKALDDAVFKARKGQLVGPVKTQFGYYVFKVQKITKASQQSLRQARDTIRQLLASQNQQKALEAFVKDFRNKWKDKTNCRKGYVVQDCKNAPKPKTNTTTGPPPQGEVERPQPEPEQER
jgi:foldase protein PrsA